MFIYHYRTLAIYCF